MPQPQLSYDEAIAVLQKAPSEYQFAIANGKPWWTHRDLADALGVTARQASLWAANIKGAYQVSGVWNVPRTELILFVAQIYLDGRAGGARA